MKVAILTIHHVPNFGALLQAYALSRTVEALGHEVTVLDYRPDVAMRHYYRSLFSGGRLKVKAYVGSQLRKHKTMGFVGKYLPLSDRIYATSKELRDDTGRYDAVIVGSDQIWCTDKGSFRGFDPTFFLDFLDGAAVRKISYAASTGETPDFGEHTERIGELLNDFFAVSVRESHTVAMVGAISRHTPEHVVDPTLLHDFEAVTPRKALPDRPYVVVYGSRPNKEQWKIVEGIARKQSAVLVAGSPLKDARFDYNYGYTDPATWLALIKNAAFVVTSFYHGVVLATKFGVPFLALPDEKKSRKVNDFLQRFDLSHRVLADSNEIDDAILDGRDIEARRPAIDEACEHGRGFLRDTLS